MERLQATDAERCCDKPRSDRRSAKRYPLELELKYTVRRGGRVLHFGAGRTQDMSSNGLSFVCDQVLRPDTNVELTICWPVLLWDTCPLNLMVTGRVARSDGQRTAIEMRQYTFRTRGSRSAVQPKAAAVMAANS